jgi:hypothetical protein
MIVGTRMVVIGWLRQVRTGTTSMLHGVANCAVLKAEWLKRRWRGSLVPLVWGACGETVCGATMN